MDTKPETSGHEVARGEDTRVAKRLEAMGWGVALLWIGVAALLNFGWPLVLLGLGVVVLVMQGVRLGSGLKPEPFWLVLGAVMLVAGLWELLAGTSFPIIPVALILLGLALLGSVVSRKGSQ
jgi:hypothetical protein